MTTKDIIGLTGKAGSGKDTAGQYLVERYGYRRFAYADALKQAALHINPIIYDNERLAPLVAEHGMDFVKRTHPEARRFLQELGLAMRGVDPLIWLNPLDFLASSLAPTQGIVVTDVRFDNEAQQVLDLGGVVIEVVRPGTGLEGEAGKHASEAGVDADLIDLTLYNDGSLVELHARLDGLLRRM